MKEDAVSLVSSPVERFYACLAAVLPAFSIPEANDQRDACCRTNSKISFLTEGKNC
jgi:hypothetical protein